MGISERTIAEFIIDQAKECQSSKAFTKVRDSPDNLSRDPHSISCNILPDQGWPAGPDSHGHAREPGEDDVEHHSAHATGQ